MNSSSRTPVSGRAVRAVEMPAGRSGVARTARKSPGAAALFLLCLTLALGLLSAGCSGGLSVNGVAVSRSGLKAEVERRLSVIRKKRPAEMKGARGERLKAETERQVATELLRAELMRQQAEKLGVKLPPDEVNRKLDSERARLGEDRFRKDLADQGLGEYEYRQKLEERALVDAIGAEVTKNIVATPEEAESYYLTHRDRFSRSLMVRAAHVLLDSRGQAEMIAEEAKRGRDFSELAMTFSRDDASRPLGGDLGWIEQGTREPALEAVAFSMSPGQVSGAVKASDGFHVIKVLDRREGSAPSFEEIRGRAIEMVTGNKKDEAFSDWLRSAYANAKVDTGGIGEWDPRLGVVVGR